jgi:hypothetical protein
LPVGRGTLSHQPCWHAKNVCPRPDLSTVIHRPLIAPTPSRLVGKPGPLTTTHQKVPRRTACSVWGWIRTPRPSSSVDQQHATGCVLWMQPLLLRVYITRADDFVLGYIGRPQTSWVRESATGSSYPKGLCSVSNTRRSSHRRKVRARTPSKYLPRSTSFVGSVNSQAQQLIILNRNLRNSHGAAPTQRGLDVLPTKPDQILHAISEACQEDGSRTQLIRLSDQDEVLILLFQPRVNEHGQPGQTS